MSQLDISVVICAYTDKRWDDLIAAVESMENQTIPPREIILVIDHNPALLERARAQFPNVKLIENQQARGISGARNTGALASTSAVVSFIDDDAEALPDCLEQIWPAYNDPNVIGVGGAITPRWPDGRPGWFPEEFDWVVGCTYRGMPTEPKRVRNFIGANMSFRREVFDTVNLYSGIGHIGNIPFGGSDPDFCIRVQQAFPNRAMIYQPKARVYHRVSQQRTKWNYFRVRCYNEGLSKSLLTSRVGRQSALSSERTYTVKTLPAGVIRGVIDTITNRNFQGIKRSAAIIGGFSYTLWGYIRGTIRQRMPQASKMLNGEVAT